MNLTFMSKDTRKILSALSILAIALAVWMAIFFTLDLAWSLGFASATLGVLANLAGTDNLEAFEESNGYY